MRTTINYELTYFKKGEELKKTIPIKWVSNRVYEWYQDIQERTNAILTINDDIKKATENLAMVIIDHDKSILERRKLSKPYSDEIKNLKKKLKETDNGDFVQARFKLVERILSDSGVDDPELYDINFWEDCTEPGQIQGFIIAAITKDMQGKKKVTT